MPRTQFERRTNALLVSDALNNLDVNTYVNDRNDICIDGFKISLYIQGLVPLRQYLLLLTYVLHGFTFQDQLLSL